jgi:hypothetical protein
MSKSPDLIVLGNEVKVRNDKGKKYEADVGKYVARDRDGVTIGEFATVGLAARALPERPE